MSGVDTLQPQSNFDITASIELISYRGAQIRSLIPELAKLRIEIFKEYPFLYDGSEENEYRYLNKFTEVEDAVAILAFDGKVIIGAITGLPFVYEDSDSKRPFLEHSLDPEKYFYLSELILKKAYRGRGIGRRLFDLCEEYAFRLRRFSYACFCTVNRATNDPKRPLDYKSPQHLWNKKGYKPHPELTCDFVWKEVGESVPSSKEMVFWIKRL